jgi:hypothetical protein
MLNGMLTIDEDLIDIENRNSLRREAKLPLLNVLTELARLAAIRERAEFEREFERRRPDLCHQWICNKDGWLANMGRYSLARQQVRNEMRARRT